MLKVRVSTVIEAPAEDVWALVRDFNGHEAWHPAIASSTIERGEPSDAVGCTRRFRLVDGQELSERLLTLSDLEMTFSYCLLDTPIPLFNYVAHLRVSPVTDVDHAFCEWESRFHTREGEEAAMRQLVADGIYLAGFRAIRERLLHGRSQS